MAHPHYCVGKKIARVETQQFEPRDFGGQRETELSAIYFTDGSRLILLARESDYEPYVKGIFQSAATVRKITTSRPAAPGK